jgi:hypothetical protein
MMPPSRVLAFVPRLAVAVGTVIDRTPTIGVVTVLADRVIMPRDSAAPSRTPRLPTVIAPKAKIVPTKASPRGAIDHPEDVGRLSASGEDDAAGRGRIQRGVDLEDEDGVRLVLAIQRHSPSQCERRSRLVDSGGERNAILVSGETAGGRATYRVVVGGLQVDLCLDRRRVVSVGGAAHRREVRGEPRNRAGDDCVAGGHPEVTAEGGEAEAVDDIRPAQCRIGSRST